MMSLYANFAKAETGFQLMLAAYTLALGAYIWSLFTDGEHAHKAARWLFLGAFAVNAFTLVSKGVETGRPPFKTFYESLIYFGFLFAGLNLLIQRWVKARLMGALASAIVLAALGYALKQADVEPPMMPPALQSAWFLPHVSMMFIAYSSFTIAFVLGIVALLKPGAAVLSPGTFAHRAFGIAEADFEKLTIDWIRVGFLFIGAGLISGGLWGKLAWTDYWAWDPKENWGLITFLAYGLVLHMNHTKEWRGRRAIQVSVGAWGLVLFTYFGMSSLPTKGQSMHIYTQPDAATDGVNGVNKSMY